MKKIMSLVSILIFVFLAITGCSKASDEKMCQIEIADSNNTVIAKLENQSQSDVSEFLDESGWKQTQMAAENLTAKYVISVYQEKTKTVIKTDSDEYEKIMEYVIYKNSDIVKVSIGEDAVNGMISGNLLTEYYIASPDFFSEVDSIVSNKQI